MKNPIKSGCFDTCGSPVALLVAEIFCDEERIERRICLFQVFDFRKLQDKIVKIFVFSDFNETFENLKCDDARDGK